MAKTNMQTKIGKNTLPIFIPSHHDIRLRRMRLAEENFIGMNICFCTQNFELT